MLRFLPMVEMTLREKVHIHKRHFEEVGEAYASDPRLRNPIVKEQFYQVEISPYGRNDM